MTRKKLVLNYYQAELCLLILANNKAPVDIKIVKGVHSLFSILRDKIKPRPPVPVFPVEGASEEIKAEYNIAIQDYQNENIELNKSEIELLLLKEELAAMKDRLRTFEGYNTSNDFAREQIVDLAKIVGI